MPSFTFVSTANAFALRGARPVFVDIRPDTLNIDETLILPAITPRTKAIVPVHYGGVACAMDEILRIAMDSGLVVIEDAAQALLSTYKGKSLGALGHIGCLSFHETKNVISGEGGALLVNKDLGPELVDRWEIVWERGRTGRPFFKVILTNIHGFSLDLLFCLVKSLRRFYWPNLSMLMKLLTNVDV